MAITDWPAQDRPREKLLQKGAASLTDAELLAIFLRTGVRNKSAVDLARELLNAFGSLRSLFDANIREFCQHHGLGTAKYTQLQAVLEMANRHLQETMDRNDVLSCPEITRRYLMSRLRTRQQEVFACLFLDNQNAVIHFEELFYGTIHSASVHPREIVKRCLYHNAAAVILAHNHPSGVAEPSQSDIRITERIQQALDLVDIRLLDHMIIGDGEVVSFAEQGLI